MSEYLDNLKNHTKPKLNIQEEVKEKKENTLKQFEATWDKCKPKPSS